MLTRRRERGSVLMLMPAAVLIVLMLAAVAVDLSLVFLRQRQAASHAVDLANDLATLGLDDAAFRAGGDYQLVDDDDLTALARRRAAMLLGNELVDVTAIAISPTRVQVHVILRADYLFAKALPGELDSTEVTGTATAEAAAG